MVEAETDAKVADGMANGTFEDVNFRRVKEMDEDGKENEQNKAVRMDEDHELKEEKESKQEEEREVENTEAVKMEEEKGSKKRGKGRNAGGKEVVKKKLVDEKSAEESSALVASSSDRPVRKRKSVKRQVVSIEKEVMEEFHIEKGIGTPLKEIPNVADKLSRKKTDDIFKMLFMILFGRRGKAFDIKKNMSQFSGFVCHENEEKQRLKIKEKFDKCIKEKLLEFCDVLDIPVAKATRKEDIVMKLIDFLAAPHAMTDVLLAEKEESSKARKRKRVVKRSAKSRGVSAKCLARFKMQEYSQSSSIQTESETMRKLRVEVHNLTQQVNELRAMVDEMWLKVSRYNNSNGIGGDNLNNARCKLLHWMGTGEVVAEGQITSTNPQSLLYHHVPIGPLCWKVLVNHVIVHNVHLYRPMPEMFTLKDAIRSTIAWPNEFIILDA